MKHLPTAVLALAAALAMAPAAKADTFDFTFSDGGVVGSGTLTGTFEGFGNPWLITDCAACTFSDGDDSGSVSLVANPNGPGGSNAVGGITYDDLLDLFQVSGTYLTENGLLFEFGSGDYLNIFFGYSVGGGGPVYYGWYDSPQGNGDFGFESETGSFTITSYDIPASETPEPGTLLLMATGMLGLGVFLYRKSKPTGLALKS
jgi:PEP-CTERM motif